MGKTSTVTFIVVALGAIALYMAPVGRLLLLYLSLGMAPLTTLMFVEGMVALARNATPWRTTAHFKPADIERRDLPRTVLLYELGVSALALAVLAATARWWQPLLGIAAPPWLFVLVAVRSAGTSAMVAITLLKRPVVGLVSLLDTLVVLPLVAMFGHSLAAVAIASLVITWLLVIFIAMRAPTTAQLARAGSAGPRSGAEGGAESIEKATAKKVSKPDESSSDALEPTWPLGSWLSTLSGYIKRPLFVAIAGAAVIVPYSAAGIIGSLLALPFCAVALHPMLPRSNVLRATVGVMLAGVVFLVMRELGPAAYRAVYPDSFGDGSWLRLLAWGSVAMIPLTLRGAAKKTTQWQKATVGLVYAGLLIGLSLAYGTPGFLVASSLGVAVNASISLSNRKAEPLFSD